VNSRCVLRRSIWGVFCAGMLLLLSQGCSKDDPIVGPAPPIFGSGNVITESRELDSVFAIRVELQATISIGQADSQSIDVSVDDNLQQYVETVVENGTLILRVADSVTITSYDLDIEIKLPDIRRIAVSGIATIVSSTVLDVDQLEVSVTGTGTIVLEVTAERLSTSVTGIADIDYEGMVTEHTIIIIGSATLSSYDLGTTSTTVSISGVGTLLVRALDELDVSISGVGTVHYKGHPTVTEDITGSGQVIDENPGPGA